MRHRNSAIHAESFNLVEHWIVCWVGGITTKHTARRNHSHGRSAPLHSMNLHRRSLRTQRKSLGGVKRVLRIPRRMAFGNIQGVEVIEICLNFAIVFDGIAKGNKNVFDTLTHQRDWVQMALSGTTARNRDIDCFAGCASIFDYLIERLLSSLEGLRHRRFSFLHELTE